MGNTASKNQDVIRRFTWVIAAIDVHLEELRYFWAKTLGISGPQWMILMALVDLDQDDGVPVNVVSKKLHVDSSFVTTQSKLLEKKGFLRRKTSAEDARIVQMSLTDKTYKHLASLASQQEALNEFIFAELNDKQLSELTETLQRLQNRLEKAMPEDGRGHLIRRRDRPASPHPRRFQAAPRSSRKYTHWRASDCRHDPAGAAVSPVVNIFSVTSRPSAFRRSYSSRTRSAFSQPRSPVEISTGHLMLRATRLIAAAGRIPPRPACAHQEGALMQIPDAAVAHRRRKAVVEGDPARDEGGAPAIRQNRDPRLVDVAALDQVIHDDARSSSPDRSGRRSARIGVLPGAEQVDREQRHAAFAGMARDLVEDTLPCAGRARRCR